MRIRNVIFDLDGTLLDTSRGVVESVEYTVREMGWRTLSEQELLSFIGPPLRKAFTEICGCTEADAEQAVRVFRAYYQAGAVLHAAPYGGMEELCCLLRRHGIRLGVATNKPQRFADALIRSFGFDRYIRSVFGADETGTRSKADLIRLCMDDLDAAASDTVLVGDTDNDAAGAAQAGVFFAAVTYGFGFRSAADVQHYPCIGTADTPMQIFSLLKNADEQRRCNHV